MRWVTDAEVEELALHHRPLIGEFNEAVVAEGLTNT